MTDADASIVEIDGHEETSGDRHGSKAQRSTLCKKYGPWFVWGQLNAWYKQTVYDPTASLSAERRGTISLPDVECAFAGQRNRYTAKVINISCVEAAYEDQYNNNVQEPSNSLVGPALVLPLVLHVSGTFLNREDHSI